MKKYEMSGKRILILDSQGDLTEKIRENIHLASLSLPDSIDVMKTPEGVVKKIESGVGYSLLVISALDYNRDSIIGQIYRNGVNSRIIDPEWDIIRILHEITNALGCTCSCGA